MRLSNVSKIGIIILLCMLRLGGCIQCYQCRSDKDANCQKLEGKTYLKECVYIPPSGETEEPSPGEDGNTTANIPSELTDTPTLHCRKIEQKLYIKKDEPTVTIRECAKLYIGVKCIYTSNKVLYRNVCDCKKDACNKSTYNCFISNFLISLSLTLIYILII